MTICANLIVRNEAAVIERCLASLVPHVDAFAVLDTGSMDATLRTIADHCSDHGLTLHVENTAFRDFSQARNDALALARRTSCDYILFCDADHELHAEPGWKQGLTEPVYAARIDSGRGFRAAAVPGAPQDRTRVGRRAASRLLYSFILLAHDRL